MRTLNIFNNPIVWVSSLSYYYSDSNLGGSREKMYTFLCVAVSLFFILFFYFKWELCAKRVLTGNRGRVISIKFFCRDFSNCHMIHTQVKWKWLPLLFWHLVSIFLEIITRNWPATNIFYVQPLNARFHWSNANTTWLIWPCKYT